MKEVSVIVPVFNEEESLKVFVPKLHSVLDGLNKEYECIFVDDGSTDKSHLTLRDFQREIPNMKIIRFKRNFGQTAALKAGIDRAEGAIIIPIDADMQNDPEDIPLLLNKAQEGYDVVSGWRKPRIDPLFTKKIPSKIANRLISTITGVYLHDYGCTLKAYKREAIKNISLYGEMHRFLPALASWNGVSIAELPIRHYPRRYGQTKYGLSRISKVILDLITVKFLLSFSTKPIQLFGYWGLVSLFLGGISGTAVILMKYFQNKDMTGNPLLYLTILLLIVGIQFIMMGLLGEMMARIYHESHKNPTYMIKEEN